MSTTKQKFIHTRLFKIIVIFVYLYSFIQLDADESPIQINVNSIEGSSLLDKISSEISAPLLRLTKLFGQHRNTATNNPVIAPND